MAILGKIIMSIGIGGIFIAEMFVAFQFVKTIAECEGKASGIVAGVFMAAMHLFILGIVILSLAH